MSLRRKRLVRIHFKDADPSIEGVFVGFWASHYVIRAAKAIESEDREYSLDGVDAVIPKERVLFMQRFK